MGPWLGYDEVFLDCDSTLTATEGIDELARLKGMEEAIERLTRRAMEGEVPLEEVYAQVSVRPPLAPAPISLFLGGDDEG